MFTGTAIGAAIGLLWYFFRLNGKVFVMDAQNGITHVGVGALSHMIGPALVGLAIGWIV